MISLSISSLGVVYLYSGGVTLARNNPNYHNPIFIGTIIVSLVSPHILNTTTYIFKKYNQKNMNKKLKK